MNVGWTVDVKGTVRVDPSKLDKSIIDEEDGIHLEGDTVRIDTTMQQRYYTETLLPALAKAAIEETEIEAHWEMDNRTGYARVEPGKWTWLD